MNNKVIPFLLGLALGFSGMKWFFHLFYIAVIVLLLYTR